MKYLFIVGAVFVIYYVFIRETPVVPVTEALAQTEVQPLLSGSPTASTAPAGSGLKRPLDRTQQVLGDVQQRNGTGQF